MPHSRHRKMEKFFSKISKARDEIKKGHYVSLDELSD